MADIDDGNDLNRYLSRASETAFVPSASRPPKLGRRQDRDLLLADWGLHHMHLSTQVESDGFVARTRDLLFAAFIEDDSYLIGIYPHGSWALTDMLRIFVRNWGPSGLLQRTAAKGLAQSYTDDDRLSLRNAGIVALLDLDGVVYFPRGQTMAGTPMSIVRGVQQLMVRLEDLRTSLVNDARHLDSHLDAVSQQRSRELSWRPFVQGEDLGFTTGEHTVSLGRLT